MPADKRKALADWSRGCSRYKQVLALEIPLSWRPTEDRADLRALSLRPHSLLQACNTPRRTSGSVKAHHPRSADQSAISKPTVTLTRNVSSPVAAMSLRRRLLALTPPSAPMLPVPACAAHRRLRPRGPGPAFLMGRKPEMLCFRHRSLPQRPAETFRHGNMESH